MLINNRPATFITKVRGQSMIDAHLSDGDLAIVDRSIQPRDGDVVVVDVDGERSFKVWRREDDGSCLQFANASLPAFRAPPDASIDVWGVSQLDLSRPPCGPMSRAYALSDGDSLLLRAGIRSEAGADGHRVVE